MIILYPVECSVRPSAPRQIKPVDLSCVYNFMIRYPDSKVHGAKMGPIWGRQDPGGPRVGPTNFAIWVEFYFTSFEYT